MVVPPQSVPEDFQTIIKQSQSSNDDVVGDGEKTNDTLSCSRGRIGVSKSPELLERGREGERLTSRTSRDLGCQPDPTWIVQPPIGPKIIDQLQNWDSALWQRWQRIAGNPSRESHDEQTCSYTLACTTLLGPMRTSWRFQNGGNGPEELVLTLAGPSSKNSETTQSGPRSSSTTYDSTPGRVRLGKPRNLTETRSSRGQWFQPNPFSNVLLGLTTSSVVSSHRDLEVYALVGASDVGIFERRPDMLNRKIRENTN
ncbi:hypothetical protein BDN72DRAFT_862145 [Pluteus cervinus]|uniref:Uncharacterized protein n=1 Tax=Pluteus cervinus TaxID=181527 RepID=A0ACD3ACU0_9AGAR|nr:hypothetical protein BDN72DRAFT_862145 [Pluteus cervinus]